MDFFVSSTLLRFILLLVTANTAVLKLPEPANVFFDYCLLRLHPRDT